MEKYKALIADLKKDDPEKEKTSEYKDNLKKHFKEYATFSVIEPELLKAYADDLISFDVQHDGQFVEVLQVYPEVLRTSTNQASLGLWLQYIEMLESLIEKKSELAGAKLKQAYEQALDHVGLTNVEAGELLIKYVDHEVSQKKVQSANLICFLAVGAPLSDGAAVQAKYIELIENNFEVIFEGLTAEDSGKDIPEKYKVQHKNLGKFHHFHILRS